MNRTTDDLLSERNELFDFARSLGRDWLEFYLQVAAWQDQTIGTRRRWELAGYETWGSFEKDLLVHLQESRTTFHTKLRTVKLVGEELIRRLGKTKAFHAARLMKAGKWNQGWESRLSEMDTETARLAVRAECSKTEEGRRRLIFYLVESQWKLANEQIERIGRLIGSEKKEAAFDFMLGAVATMANEEIAAEAE